MKYTVMGLEYRNYVSKKTNRPVDGYNLYLSYPLSTGEGDGCEKIWVKPEIFEIAGNVCVGDSVEILYNRYGSVASLIIC